MTRTKSKNAEGTKAQLFENRIIDPKLWSVRSWTDLEPLLDHWTTFSVSLCWNFSISDFGNGTTTTTITIRAALIINFGYIKKYLKWVTCKWEECESLLVSLAGYLEPMLTMMMTLCGLQQLLDATAAGTRGWGRGRRGGSRVWRRAHHWGGVDCLLALGVITEDAETILRCGTSNICGTARRRRGAITRSRSARF